jgi:glycosyltransferase involved in cell wall biosynthesis
MSSDPKVTVIIIFLNAAPYLNDAVESVLYQTYTDWELLLVDDGSTDESSDMARAYAGRQPGRIFYVEHEGHQNLGMSSSRNRGLSEAQGMYVAFLDADDCWLPEKLETHVSYLDAHPSAGMLFGSTKYWYSWTGRPEDALRDYVPESRVRTTTLFQPPRLFGQFLEGKVEIPCPCSVMVRIDAAADIGGFEDSFRGMYEDQVFYMKMSLNKPILAVNDSLARYRQHPNSISSVSARLDQTNAMHYSFLKWVESYCRTKKVQDSGVLQAVHRQLWLHSSRPVRFYPCLSPQKLRWIKKWMLRVEERILPSLLRNWLWSEGRH